MNTKELALYLLVAATITPACWSQTGVTVVNIKPIINPNSNPNPLPSAPSNLKAVDNGIQYHGGPVMSAQQGVNVYVIWYGNWSSPSDTAAQSIVIDFLENLGGSPYFNINTTYFDHRQGLNPVPNRVNYIGSTTDNYSRGTVIGDQDVGYITEQAITTGKFPLDPKGVYFVITSADVDETSGFCVQYCAFHGFDTVSNFISVGSAQHNPSSVNLPVAFAGHPERCPVTCTEQPQLPTPNDNVAADGLVNMIAHELAETISDPLANAWFAAETKVGTRQQFQEIGDLCQWTFGQTTTLPNGSLYNVTLGDRHYLLQRLWVNALGGYCALSWVNGAQ